MSARRRRTVIVSVAALCVAVVLVAAATTGSSVLVGELRSEAPSSQVSDDEPPADEPTDRATDTPPAPERADDLGDWLQDLLAFALLVAALVLTSGALRLLAQGLARRLPAKQLVLDLEPLPDLEAARVALRRDREVHDATLGGSDARNSIVACWVRLEETAAEVGVTRGPAETSTELVVRFLHAVDIDPRPVALLAALYQEARFSTHPLPDDARSRARQALAGIHADLDWGAVT
ncbi:MAG: DUF4129 domain-containing protein [Marmoricola sp.]